MKKGQYACLKCGKNYSPPKGDGMIVFGWLFTIIGLVGGVVSFILYRNEYNNYGKRINNFWEGNI